MRSNLPLKASFAWNLSSSPREVFELSVSIEGIIMVDAACVEKVNRFFPRQVFWIVIDCSPSVFAR